MAFRHSCAMPSEPQGFRLIVSQGAGLRRAAGRRLAEAGCSTKQIMAVLGHKSIAEAERYTRDADQIRLATDAMSRLEAQTENEVCPNRPFQFGQVPKTSGETM